MSSFFLLSSSNLFLFLTFSFLSFYIYLSINIFRQGLSNYPRCFGIYQVGSASFCNSGCPGIHNPLVSGSSLLLWKVQSTIFTHNFIIQRGILVKEWILIKHCWDPTVEIYQIHSVLFKSILFIFMINL